MLDNKDVTDLLFNIADDYVSRIKQKIEKKEL